MSTDLEVFEVASALLGNLRRSGSDNVMAFCPFHQNRVTPSFALSLTTGLWFCHSCKERGNFKKLLLSLGVTSHLVGVKYSYLLEQLTEEANRKLSKPRCVVLDFDAPPLEEAVLGLFEGCPIALLDEGFTEETLWKFDVGYDERNQRITFPLRDLLGRLMGFSGRAIGEGYPRYKIYDKAEYEAWGITPRKTKKDTILWNLDKVYPEALFNPNPEIVIVEGFKACMWLHQAGFHQAVALLGSHISHQQRLLLERLGGTVYVFVDNDTAGQAARDRTARELSQALRVKVVQYEGKQPTDLSPEAVTEAIKTSTDYIKWAIDRR